MEQKNFIEECFVFTTRDITKILKRASGTGYVAHSNIRSDIEYRIENLSDPAVVLLSINGKEPQKINLEWKDLTFGERAYFRCVCNRRVSKIYLPQCLTEFKCRICHNLKYRLSTFNRYSIAGKVIYKMDRLQKLSNNRASMSRIFYNGHYTKRFEKFLKLCDKAGLDSIVKGADDLKALIHG